MGASGMELSPPGDGDLTFAPSVIDMRWSWFEGWIDMPKYTEQLSYGKWECQKTRMWGHEESSSPKGTPRASITRWGGALRTLGLKIRGLWGQCFTSWHRVPGHEIAVANRKWQGWACWECEAHVTGSLDERISSWRGRGPECAGLTQMAVMNWPQGSSSGGVASGMPCLSAQLDWSKQAFKLN